MSTAAGRLMGKPSVKALRKWLSGRVADRPVGERSGLLKATSLAGAALPLDNTDCPRRGILLEGGEGCYVITDLEGTKWRTMKTELLRFNGAVERDPAIDAWMKEHAGELGAIAHQWFEVMRKCGDEVRELLHDGCPVACLGDAPFGYVNVFTSHVNVGFFHGAALPDPARLLQGTGKFMRHVKLRPGTATNAAALSRLIDSAYSDIKARVENGT
jgi:hypothetical protein